jgi:hypothetical protein
VPTPVAAMGAKETMMLRLGEKRRDKDGTETVSVV